MKKNYNVDLEKLDKILDRIIAANLALSQSETLDEHARARYRSALAQLMTVQQLISNPEFFQTIWDLYMLED